MIVVGLCGYIQSGKDTVGSIMVQDHGYVRMAFGDILKRVAVIIDPIIPIWSSAAAWLRDRRLLALGPFARLSDIVRVAGWETAKKIKEVRRFIQVLGTEAGRHILGRDVWVEALHQEMRRLKEVSTARLRQGFSRFVITDVRFPNEGDYVRLDNKGFLVLVDNYRAEPNACGMHSSEAYVKLLSHDYVIDNNGTISDLRKIVARFVKVVEANYVKAENGEYERVSTARHA